MYPYELMNSFKKFFEDRLPNRREFYSFLSGEYISDKDYLYAVNVWNMFEMKTIGDYHDLYLGKDVLLSADVFEEFTGVYLELVVLD